MLELEWVKLRTKKGKTAPPIAYVHGELFGAGGMKAIPDNLSAIEASHWKIVARAGGNGTL